MLPQLLTALIILTNPATPQVLGASSVPTVQAQVVPSEKVLATHSMPLNDRYGNSFVNDVFKDNILLTLKYMSGDVKKGDKIDWTEIEKPTHFEFNLKPNERFAFHDIILPEYKDNEVKTTNAHFNFDEGFKSDGYLIGDGVCHFASLIYWAAKDAGISAVRMANHDFAVIPDVPKEYGVAIYANPSGNAGAYQNLYITNSLKNTIKFVFDYKDNVLNFSVLEN